MVNRVNPLSYAQDATLRRLIDVVSFGLPAKPPEPQRPAIREEVAAIAAADVVVLWGGGIWNWFDPLTAIRAVAALGAEIPALKLFFMGLRHPNPDLPQMTMARRAVELAAELGVLDRQVFFRDGWVPYEERVNYLMSADIGISLHWPAMCSPMSWPPPAPVWPFPRPMSGRWPTRCAGWQRTRLRGRRCASAPAGWQRTTPGSVSPFRCSSSAARPTEPDPQAPWTSMRHGSRTGCGQPGGEAQYAVPRGRSGAG